MIHLTFLLWRFTPTPVGNTLAKIVADSIQTVHPHACGEYEEISRISSLESGSPPRLWGIHIILRL